MQADINLYTTFYHFVSLHLLRHSTLPCTSTPCPSSPSRTLRDRTVPLCTTFHHSAVRLPPCTTRCRCHELPRSPRGAAGRRSCRLIRCAWWRRRRRLASLPVVTAPRRKRRVVDRRAASLTPSPPLSPPSRHPSTSRCPLLTLPLRAPTDAATLRFHRRCYICFRGFHPHC